MEKMVIKVGYVYIKENKMKLSFDERCITIKHCEMEHQSTLLYEDCGKWRVLGNIPHNSVITLSEKDLLKFYEYSMLIAKEKSEYIGYSNNKQYDVFEIDKDDKLIGLCDVDDCTNKCWCTFDKIEKRSV